LAAAHGLSGIWFVIVQTPLRFAKNENLLLRLGASSSYVAPFACAHGWLTEWKNCRPIVVHVVLQVLERKRLCARGGRLLCFSNSSKVVVAVRESKPQPHFFAFWFAPSFPPPRIGAKLASMSVAFAFSWPGTGLILSICFFPLAALVTSNVQVQIHPCERNLKDKF